MVVLLFSLLWSALQVDFSQCVEKGQKWLVMELTIPKDHYVYGQKTDGDATPLKVTIEGVPDSQLQWECPVYDKELGMEVYKDNIIILSPYDRSTGKVHISYGMCTDAFCLPPSKIDKDIHYDKLPEAKVEVFKRYKKLCAKAASWSFMPLIFAFLGGLLLNVMPCVLPVLSIKMVSFLQNTTSRLHNSLLYAAGNIATFITLGLLTGALQTIGSASGWGFHLQNPLFVFGLACVFVIMIMSIFDLVIFPIFQTSTPHSSFWTGVMTVIVGAPCTVPLMSTAVSYGLTQTPLESILIFASLGLGMATPFLCLSVLPMRFLPQPGNWLKWVKPTLGFILMITVIWLLQIYTALTSLDHFLIIGGVLISIAYVLWLWGQGLVNVWIAFTLVIGLVGGGILQTLHKPMESVPYSEKVLTETIDAGKNVLIYATAKWCLSCKINAMVLQKNSIQKALKEKNTVLMVADYTNQDEAITLLLRKHNIAGVPATILIKGDKSTVLPEVLTEAAVQSVL